MNKEVIFFIGLTMLITGIFFSFSALSLTGFATAESYSNFSFPFGLILFLGGLFVFISQDALQKRLFRMQYRDNIEKKIDEKKGEYPSLDKEYLRGLAEDELYNKQCQPGFFSRLFNKFRNRDVEEMVQDENKYSKGSNYQASMQEYGDAKQEIPQKEVARITREYDERKKARQDLPSPVKLAVKLRKDVESAGIFEPVRDEGRVEFKKARGQYNHAGVTFSKIPEKYISRQVKDKFEKAKKVAEDYALSNNQPFVFNRAEEISRGVVKYKDWLQEKDRTYPVPLPTEGEIVAAIKDTEDSMRSDQKKYGFKQDYNAGEELKNNIRKTMPVSRLAKHYADMHVNEARSMPVSEIAHEYGVVIASALPFAFSRHLGNNKTISQEEVSEIMKQGYSKWQSFVDRALNGQGKMRIAASSFSSRDDSSNFYSPIGIIIKEGKVFDASYGDMTSVAVAETPVNGTEVAYTKHRFRTEGGGGMTGSWKGAINEEENLPLEQRVRGAATHGKIGVGVSKERGHRWNELLVDVDKIGGFFFVASDEWYAAGEKHSYLPEQVEVLARIAISKKMPLYKFVDKQGFVKVDPRDYLEKAAA